MHQPDAHHARRWCRGGDQPGGKSSCKTHSWIRNHRRIRRRAKLPSYGDHTLPSAASAAAKPAVAPTAAAADDDSDCAKDDLLRQSLWMRLGEVPLDSHTGQGASRIRCGVPSHADAAADAADVSKCVSTVPPQQPLPLQAPPLPPSVLRPHPTPPLPPRLCRRQCAALTVCACSSSPSVVEVHAGGSGPCRGPAGTQGARRAQAAE